MAKKEKPIVKKVVVDRDLGSGWECSLIAHNNQVLTVTWYRSKAAAVKTANRIAAQLGVPVDVESCLWRLSNE